MTLEVSQVEAAAATCRAWLQAKISPIFWDMFERHLQNLDYDRKDFIRARGYKSLIKAMSYDGAIRISPEAPAAWVAWRDAHTNQAYMDPGNAVYARVMRLCWPTSNLAAGPYNQETVGDYAEAFLAYQWRRRMDNVAIDPLISTFVQQLECLCFMVYVQDNTPRAGGLHLCG